MPTPYDAIIIGSGPNGLTAAALLSKRGFKVKIFEAQGTHGGGMRTQALTGPGYLHDVCSAVHPMAVASPVFRSLDLAGHGVELIHPTLPFVHPLQGGDAAVLHRSVAQTAAGLGQDERAYVKLMKPIVDAFDDILTLTLNPFTKPPPLHRPLALMRFGISGLQSAHWFAEENFEGPHAKALLAGCAAHSFSSLTTPMTTAVGLVLLAAAHAVGWPIIRGGSQRLADGLLSIATSQGAELQCSAPIRSLSELPESRLVLFDTHAEVMARICADALPGWYHSQLASFRRGPGVFKIDYALDAPMPWLNEAARRAGTVHLGGTLPELSLSERTLSEGGLAERPFVLVAQQSLFDSTRAPAGHHTLWAYCHVPNGSGLDATGHIDGQLERWAPGFSRHVVAKSVRTPRDFETHNPSFVGGDIMGGMMEGAQLFLRPTMGKPYVTPNPKVMLCSASSPPGGGVHGMCGYWAAEVAEMRLRATH